MKQFTIGADVENFLTDGKDFKSAARILEGTKYQPTKLSCGAGLHKDNVAAEYASSVASDEDSFVEAVMGPVEEILQLVGPLDMSKVSYAEFPKTQVTLDEEQQFGCEPDFDAWGLTMNEPPVPPTETFRSCGGHVHIGFTDKATEPGRTLADAYGKISVVKLMDIFLGIPFSIIDKGSVKRRSIYGKAGCHRPKNYGVEYRVLSNYWTHKESTVRLVYKLTRDVLENIPKAEEIINSVGVKKVKKCINKSDVKLAHELVNRVILPNIGEDTRELLLAEIG